MLKVLVPLDGSPSSESVLDRLEWLRELPGAHLVLFQLVERGKALKGPSRGLGEPPWRQIGVYDQTGGLLPVPGTGPFGGREALEQEEVRATQEAEGYLRAVASQVRGIRVSTSSSLGTDVARSIADAARAEKATLIAMTRRRHNVLVRLFRRITWSAVLRRTDVPVLVYWAR